MALCWVPRNRNEELRDIQAQIGDHEVTLRRIWDDQWRLRENLMALQKSDSELHELHVHIRKLIEEFKL